MTTNQSLLRSLLAMLFIGVVMSIAAQVATTQKHVVQRGETLESIAEAYSTTTQAIVKANPDAEQFIYVGMELVIPVSAAPLKPVVAAQESATPAAQGNHNNATTETNTTSEKPEKVSISMDISYGFLKNPAEGMHSSSFAYQFTVGANYWFNQVDKGAYVGARIGYVGSNVQHFGRIEGAYTQLETDYHMISLPIECGYAVTTGNGMWGVAPYAGIDVNMGLKGKSKVKTGSQKESGKEKIGGKFSPNAKVGLRLILSGFNVGVSYNFILADKKHRYFSEDPFVAVSLGFGF